MPLIPRSPRLRRLACATALAAAASLGLASWASAASIVFVKAANVWVSAPDGSGAHALTTDGKLNRSEYWSPSQADDGTIVAGRQQDIVVLAPDGRRLRRFPAPGLFDAGTGSGGRPQWVSVSPDGSKIAFAMTGAGCTELDAWCRINGAVGVVSATGTPLGAGPASQVGGEPSWVGNGTVLYNRTFVTLWDVAGGTTRFWFGDGDVTGDVFGTQDLGQPELSADGRRLAVVRGDATKAVQLYDVAGDPAAEPDPAAPTPLCASPALASVADPTLSADGGEVLWAQSDGIWAWSPAGGCAAAPRLVVAQASQPDWGPADPVPAAVTPVATGDDSAGAPAKHKKKKKHPKAGKKRKRAGGRG